MLRTQEEPADRVGHETIQAWVLAQEAEASWRKWRAITFGRRRGSSRLEREREALEAGSGDISLAEMRHCCLIAVEGVRETHIVEKSGQVDVRLFVDLFLRCRQAADAQEAADCSFLGFRFGWLGKGREGRAAGKPCRWWSSEEDASDPEVAAEDNA